MRAIIAFAFLIFTVHPIQAAPTNNLAVTVTKIDRARILRLAAEAMESTPPAITDQIATNSAGGPHDFFSQADYAWPNPTNKTGLPFIGRDGESNPDVFTYHRMAMRNMKDAVAALAAAYAITGDDKYPRKAAEFIRVFFLDPKTRMNPNLKYAQAVMGSSTGEPYALLIRCTWRNWRWQSLSSKNLPRLIRLWIRG